MPKMDFNTVSVEVGDAFMQNCQDIGALFAKKVVETERKFNLTKGHLSWVLFRQKSYSGVILKNPAKNKILRVCVSLTLDSGDVPPYFTTQPPDVEDMSLHQAIHNIADWCAINVPSLLKRRLEDATQQFLADGFEAWEERNPAVVSKFLILHLQHLLESESWRFQGGVLLLEAFEVARL